MFVRCFGWKWRRKTETDFNAEYWVAKGLVLELSQN